jgi:hypothetical protein
VPRVTSDPDGDEQAPLGSGTAAEPSAPAAVILSEPVTNQLPTQAPPVSAEALRPQLPARAASTEPDVEAPASAAVPVRVGAPEQAGINAGATLNAGGAVSVGAPEQAGINAEATLNAGAAVNAGVPVGAPVVGQYVPVPGYPPPPAGYAPPIYGVPYPVYWPYPVPVRKPSRAIRATVLVLAIALAVSVFGVGVLTSYAAASGAFGAGPVWQATIPKDPPPAADAPASAWADWARRSVDDAVRIQAKALLAGDEQGFEAVADPANATLVADLKRRFAVLRALGLGQWTETLTGGLHESTSRSWSGDIRISYCFGERSCTAAEVVESSRWEVRNDQLVMVALGKTDPDENGPRPWETDQLSVVRGKRAIVAATKVNEWRLDSAIVAADKAALIADQFAKWAPAPDRYVIFLASPIEWTKWYGHDQPDWAAAWAVPVGDTVTEVVVRTEVVQQRGLENLLTHELTHVTSLAGKRLGQSSAWWLIEGIAEYATMLGQPINTYDGLEPTHAFVHGKWDGKPNVASPSTSANLDEASARYGVAFLAVRRIAEKYGQDKMVEFWGQVVHDNKSLEDASASALGAPWTTVSADCASYIRKSVG